MSGATWRDRSSSVVVGETEIRHRWRAGRCVCCAGPLTRPHAIGEGVQVCGQCRDRDHLSRPGEVDAVLRSLLGAGT